MLAPRARHPYRRITASCVIGLSGCAPKLRRRPSKRNIGARGDAHRPKSPEEQDAREPAPMRGAAERLPPAVEGEGMDRS